MQTKEVYMECGTFIIKLFFCISFVFGIKIVKFDYMQYVRCNLFHLSALSRNTFLTFLQTIAVDTQIRSRFAYFAQISNLFLAGYLPFSISIAIWAYSFLFL